MLERFRRRQGTATATCPYCRAGLVAGEETLPCPKCETRHHAECFRENGGCTVFGCGAPSAKAEARAPRWSRRLLVFWGVFVVAVGLWAVDAAHRAGEPGGGIVNADDKREHLFARVAGFLHWAQGHEAEAVAVTLGFNSRPASGLDRMTPVAIEELEPSMDLDDARETFRRLVRDGKRDPKDLMEEVRQETLRRVPRGPRNVLDFVVGSLPEKR